MPRDTAYIVATRGAWHIRAFHETVLRYPGQWHLIDSPSALTAEAVKAINPRYIFFPHWSERVPPGILELAECVCFHETDLPYGRGGSPIQNLIQRGHRETVVSALRMEAELDTGPVYFKRPLSLEGLAEEIYIRIARVVAGMIESIALNEPVPVPQAGEATVFQRRTPAESRIPADIQSLGQLFDFIRMLDAEGYPNAFLEAHGFRFEVSRPALRVGQIVADMRISRMDDPEGGAHD